MCERRHSTQLWFTRSENYKRERQGCVQLGAIRLGSMVGHAEDTAAGVRQLLLDLVREAVTPDALASSPSASRVSSLDLSPMSAKASEKPMAKTQCGGWREHTMKFLIERWKVTLL